MHNIIYSSDDIVYFSASDQPAPPSATLAVACILNLIAIANEQFIHGL